MVRPAAAARNYAQDNAVWRNQLPYPTRPTWTSRLTSAELIVAPCTSKVASGAASTAAPGASGAPPGWAQV